MCLLSVVFSLFGCSPQPVKTDSAISSISITQNHMNRAYCYAFSITETEFSEFARLNEKYGFADYTKKKNNKKYNISDETTNSFKVCFGGEALTLRSDNECYDAVYDYFITLTTKYLA